MNMNSWIQNFVLLLCLIVVFAQDYYEILGVKRDATEKEIKKKFRQLGKTKELFKKNLTKKVFFI